MSDRTPAPPSGTPSPPHPGSAYPPRRPAHHTRATPPTVTAGAPATPATAPAIAADAPAVPATPPTVAAGTPATPADHTRPYAADPSRAPAGGPDPAGTTDSARADRMAGSESVPDSGSESGSESVAGSGAESGSESGSESVAGSGAEPVPVPGSGRWASFGWPVVAVALAVLAVVTADVLAHAGLTRLDHRVADWAWAANIRHGNLLRALVVYACTMPGDILGICAVFAPYVAILAYARRTWQPVLRAGVALGLVLAAVWAGKHLVGRTAPGIVDAVRAGGHSYPSGHSAVSVVTCGVAAWLAVTYGLPAGWCWLLRVVAVAGPLLTAAGMTLLVYHWLSDTVAGLAVGVVVLRVVHLLFAGRLGHWADASRLDRLERARPVGGDAPVGDPGGR